MPICIISGTLCVTLGRMKITKNSMATLHGTFPIILQKEKEGGYSVTNLALEGCYSEGETVEEALNNIKEATLLCLEDSDVAPTKRADVSLHLITV